VWRSVPFCRFKLGSIDIVHTLVLLPPRSGTYRKVVVGAHGPVRVPR
jgi:hypothetical protein